jgi:hypothetical protein
VPPKPLPASARPPVQKRPPDHAPEHRPTPKPKVSPPPAQRPSAFGLAPGT